VLAVAICHSHLAALFILGSGIEHSYQWHIQRVAEQLSAVTVHDMNAFFVLVSAVLNFLAHKEGLL